MQLRNRQYIARPQCQFAVGVSSDAHGVAHTATAHGNSSICPISASVTIQCPLIATSDKCTTSLRWNRVSICRHSVVTLLSLCRRWTASCSIFSFSCQQQDVVKTFSFGIDKKASVRLPSVIRFLLIHPISLDSSQLLHSRCFHSTNSPTINDAD